MWTTAVAFAMAGRIILQFCCRLFFPISDLRRIDTHLAVTEMSQATIESIDLYAVLAFYIIFSANSFRTGSERLQRHDHIPRCQQEYLCGGK